MFQKDWEKRWEKYGKELAANIHTHKTADNEPLALFLESSVLLTVLLLPSIVAFGSEFPMKLETFDEKILQKKLSKAKKEAVHATIKLFLMDYFASFLEHPVHQKIIEHTQTSEQIVEKQIQLLLGFTKEDTQRYEEIKEKKETYYPTILLLKKLHFGKDANNQALVEGTELFKEEAYARMDTNFQQLLMPQKRD